MRTRLRINRRKSCRFRRHVPPLAAAVHSVTESVTQSAIVTALRRLFSVLRVANLRKEKWRQGLPWTWVGAGPDLSWQFLVSPRDRPIDSKLSSAGNSPRRRVYHQFNFPRRCCVWSAPTFGQLHLFLLYSPLPITISMKRNRDTLTASTSSRRAST